MKGTQDLIMYACLLTFCSLCFLLSGNPVLAKDVSEDSLARGSLELKNLDDIEKETENVASKRKWADYATWGKRRYGDVDDLPKRWSEGFASWGKREQEPVKRQWNQFVTWGKRNVGGDKRKDWASFSTWGKRGKWAKFNTWGKRDLKSEEFEKEITERVMQRFDEDGDQGLNREEMLAFINWLRMSGLAAQPAQGYPN